MTFPAQVPPHYVLLTIKGAAAYASVGYSTLRAAIKNGECRAIGSGKMTRTRTEWVDEWIDGYDGEDGDDE